MSYAKNVYLERMGSPLVKHPPSPCAEPPSDTMMAIILIEYCFLFGGIGVSALLTVAQEVACLHFPADGLSSITAVDSYNNNMSIWRIGPYAIIAAT